MHPPLISVAELHSQLLDPHLDRANLANTGLANTELLIVDCRFDLMKPEAGRLAYLAGHVPSAIYAHLDEDLSGAKTAMTGRHPLPTADALTATFSRFGINNSRRVVAYDADNGMFAARLWWLLRFMGHGDVAVLDGGFKAWQSAGYESSTDIPQKQARKFIGRPNSDWVVDAADVALRAQNPEWRVLDARAPERFRGDVEPIDPVAGHIPGARNHPFAWNLNAEGSFQARSELLPKYESSLAAVAPDQTIVMCGSGVTACHTLLAMEIAGLYGAKLYSGSWSEWIRDPSRAIARGSAN